MDMKQSKPTLLNDGNYARWQKEMRAFLETKQLWKNCTHPSYLKYIEKYNAMIMDEASAESDSEDSSATLSFTTVPSSTTKPDLTDKYKELLRKATPEGQEQWIDNDEKARGYLTLCVSETYKRFTKAEPGEKLTAYKIWNKLKMHGEKMNRTGRVTARQEYNRLKLREKETLKEYHTRVHRALEKLAEIGKRPDEEDIVDHVLSTLGEQNEQIVIALSEKNDGEMTFDQLGEKFQYYDNLRMNNRNDRDSTSQEKAYRPKEGLYTNSKEARSCFKCGTKGHIASNCNATEEKIAKFRTKLQSLFEEESHLSEPSSSKSSTKSKHSSSKPKNVRKDEKSKKKEAHNIEPVTLFVEEMSFTNESSASYEKQEEEEDMKYFEEYFANSEKDKQKEIPESKEEQKEMQMKQACLKSNDQSDSDQTFTEEPMSGEGTNQCNLEKLSDSGRSILNEPIQSEEKKESISEDSGRIPVQIEEPEKPLEILGEVNRLIEPTHHPTADKIEDCQPAVLCEVNANPQEQDPYLRADQNDLDADTRFKPKQPHPSRIEKLEVIRTLDTSVTSSNYGRMLSSTDRDDSLRLIHKIT
jgi:hypothetical protein